MKNITRLTLVFALVAINAYAQAPVEERTATVFSTPAEWTARNNRETFREILDGLSNDPEHRFTYTFAEGTDPEPILRAAMGSKDGRPAHISERPLIQLLQNILGKVGAQVSTSGNTLVISRPAPRISRQPHTAIAKADVDTAIAQEYDRTTTLSAAIDRTRAYNVNLRQKIDSGVELGSGNWGATNPERLGLAPIVWTPGGYRSVPYAVHAAGAGPGYRGSYGGGYGYGVGPTSGKGCGEYGGWYGQTVGCAREWRNFGGEPFVAAFKVHKTGGVDLDKVRVYVDGQFKNVASKLDNRWDAKVPMEPGKQTIIVFTTMIGAQNACFSLPVTPESMAKHLVANRGDEWYFQIPVGEKDFVVESKGVKLLNGIYDPTTSKCSDRKSS